MNTTGVLPLAFACSVSCASRSVMAMRELLQVVGGVSMAPVRLTHIGGPTVLIEVGGWRLLTDPPFDPAGGSYRFGWGTGSRKLAGPSIPASELGSIDAVLLTHDHHDDNLTPPVASSCRRRAA